MPDARLTHRINKVKEALTSIKPTIDIRRQLVGLGETNGRYCTTCGPYPNISYCSLNCPLLRTVGWIKPTEWAHMAKWDTQLYRQLALNIATCRVGVNKKMVREWEVITTDLLLRVTDPSNGSPTKVIKSHQGFDENWAFDEHWGKGPGLEVQIGPKESETPVVETEDAKTQTLEGKVANTSRAYFSKHSWYENVAKVKVSGGSAGEEVKSGDSVTADQLNQ